MSRKLIAMRAAAFTLTTATFAFLLVGIWTGDGRWLATAAVTGTTAVWLFGAVGKALMANRP